MLKNLLIVRRSFHEVIFINCKYKGRYWLLKSPISFGEADVGCLESAEFDYFELFLCLLR